IAFMFDDIFKGLGEAKYLLSKSWMLLIAGFLGMVNLKMDQAMLRWLADSREVGLYAVAVRFSEVWYFVPGAIMLSAFPRLLEIKEQDVDLYHTRQQQLLDSFVCVAFVVAVITALLAKPIIPMLFGEAYTKSSSILIIHVWAGIFMFMRKMFSKWVFAEDALVYSIVSHGSGALVNVGLNALLIPIAQGYGAAIATLLSYATSSYFFLFCFQKTRPLAVKMTKALVFPIRLAMGRKNLYS
ncbi:MAG: polysaccharide biosynthesis C-terminal domain-containing protein, partial [Planctomycetota bacterium]